MEEKKKTKSHIDWPKTIVGTITLAVLFFVIFVLVFGGKETVTSDEIENYPISSLVCNLSNTGGSVLGENVDTSSSQQEIRAIFNKDQSLRNIYYMYEGSFFSDAVAKTKMAAMHANYNDFMASKRADAEKLSPAFSNIDNRVKAQIYAEAKDFSVALNPLFLLDNNVNHDLEDVRNDYSSKGFDCKVEEKNKD